MTTKPQQLVLDLPQRSALGLEDFFVSQSNRAAVDLIDSWPDWQHWAAIIVGPSGSGKTHLATVWQKNAQAACVAASALDEGAVALIEARRALLVEDLDRGIADDRILFHLLNLAREHRLSILMTSRAPPGEMTIALPDLRSRLRALPLAEIAPPDEAVIKAVLVKLFADRQLQVEPHVVNYIALRTERSMAAVNDVVERLDLAALSMQRRVSRALAGEVLQSLFAGEDEEDDPQ